jgi:nucleotide-binding universal stress UspA family protein
MTLSNQILGIALCSILAFAAGRGMAAEVNQQPWDPNVKALTEFPSVLANMNIEEGPIPYPEEESMPKRRKGRPAIKTILVPTDFSDNSTEALDFAEILAKTLGAKIVLVHVIDTVSYIVSESLQWENVYSRLRAGVKPMLEKEVRRIDKKGLSAARDLIQGFPYDETVRKAREARADLIVMGTHGRTGMRHLLLGSVAERVVRLAPCPVLTVR